MDACGLATDASTHCDTIGYTTFLRATSIRVTVSWLHGQGKPIITFDVPDSVAAAIAETL
jgi:hypothetical protein